MYWLACLPSGQPAGQHRYKWPAGVEEANWGPLEAAATTLYCAARYAGQPQSYSLDEIRLLPGVKRA